MLTKDDLEGVNKLLEDKFNKQNKRFDRVEEKLAINTASVIKIEGKIDTALELRQDVAEVRRKVEDYEERINNLERI